MRTTVKFAAGLALAGVLTMAAATPSQARWHHWHGAAAGFAAGAVLGAAAANSYYYGPGPYYAYAPGYYAYAYEPAYAYDPGIQADYGYTFGLRTNNYGANADSRHCGVSPASSQAGICSP